MLTVGSLCSGAGFGDLGLSWAGYEHVWFSEIDPYCCENLAYHWPEVPNLGSIMDIDWDDRQRPDVVVAGFPCQPFSLAGRRHGHKDARNLWPEVVRCLTFIDPDAFIGENVPGLLSAKTNLVPYFGVIVRNLLELGYSVEWGTVSAADMGAPHRRERLFIMAVRRYSVPRGALPFAKLEHEHWRQTSLRNEMSLFADDRKQPKYRNKWPKYGCAVGITAYELPPVKRESTCRTGSDWPTATVQDARDSPAELRPILWASPNVCGLHNRKGASLTSGDGLSTQTKQWVTPQATDGAKGGPNMRHGSGDKPVLSQAAEMEESSSPSTEPRTGSIGSLEPWFVEELMTGRHGWMIE